MSLSIKILEKSDREIKFIIGGVTPAFVNAIRRVLISEIPIMSFDEIVFLENTSVLYDEIIAHRIGLVPIKNDPNEILSILESDINEFSKREAVFVLEEEAREGVKTIYSGDLKPRSTFGGEAINIEIANKKIPLVKLAEGQRLVLEAYARYGLGKNHAKFQATIASYKYMPLIEINEKLCDLCGECVRACPKNVLEIVEGKLQVRDRALCSLCNACVEVCPQGAIKVKGLDDQFIFKIENLRIPSPADAFLIALKVIEKRLKLLEESLLEIGKKN